MRQRRYAESVRRPRTVPPPARTRPRSRPPSQTLDAIDLATVSDADLKAAIDGVSDATDSLINGASPKITQQVADLEGAVNVLEAAYEEANRRDRRLGPAIKDAIADVDTAAAAAIEVTLKPDCS